MPQTDSQADPQNGLPTADPQAAEQGSAAAPSLDANASRYPMATPTPYPPATPTPYPSAVPTPYPPALPAPGRYPPAVPAGKLPPDYEAVLPQARGDARSELRPAAVAPPELSPRQQAEAEYRRGQELVRAGRGPEAISAFERALQADRGYAAARLSLASSLVDAKRVDDAMTRLQEGLDDNRADGTLAMALARLQVDRGETRAAIDTLAHTLPYDRDRPDNQAFMASLLQKEGRHREAVDYFLTALRRAPKNATWWMGLGTSLQADKRPGEAREAYQRALSVGGLSADLQGVVQQRLEQMR